MLRLLCVSLSDYFEWPRQDCIDRALLNDLAFYLTAARSANFAAGREV
jgi:hypothetical protein